MDGPQHSDWYLVSVVTKIASALKCWPQALKECTTHQWDRYYIIMYREKNILDFALFLKSKTEREDMGNVWFRHQERERTDLKRQEQLSISWLWQPVTCVHLFYMYSK